MSMRSCPRCGSDELELDVVAYRVVAIAAALFTLLTLGLGAVSFWFVPKQNLCRECAYQWRFPTINPLVRTGRRLVSRLRYHFGDLAEEDGAPWLPGSIAQRVEGLAETIAAVSLPWRARTRTQ